VLPSRALGTGEGDQQSRAELLGKLLLALDEKPYMLRHGTGRSAYHLVMVELSEDEAGELGARPGKPKPVRFGKRRMLPLQIEKGLEIGEIQGKLYDPDPGRWTGSIALMRFK